MESLESSFSLLAFLNHSMSHLSQPSIFTVLETVVRFWISSTISGARGFGRCSPSSIGTLICLIFSPQSGQVYSLSSIEDESAVRMYSALFSDKPSKYPLSFWSMDLDSRMTPVQVLHRRSVVTNEARRKTK